MKTRGSAYRRWLHWLVTAIVFLAFAAGVVVLLLWLAGKFTPKVSTVVRASDGPQTRPVAGQIVQASLFNVPMSESAVGIGMIALAGIVTRDSIILVDFIHLSLARGRTLFEAIMESRVVRLRPILLTAGAAMLGAVPIIIDPIFSGLAWSLIFGLFASTLFTLFVIPIAYWLIYANKPGHGLSQSTMAMEDAAAEAGATEHHAMPPVEVH